MPKITKTFVDKVAAPAEGYEVHWDDSVRGYGLRVSAALDADGKPRRTFFVMGRVLGKSVQFTLGPYGTLTEDAARKKAQKVLQDMREGIDPRDEKKAAIAQKVEDELMGVTLRQLADDFIGRPGKLKASSKATIERHVVTTFKAWEHLPVVSITESMCRARYKQIAQKGLHGTREGGSPGQANQAFDILRAMMNYAARQFRRGDGKPLIQENPTLVLSDHRVELKPRTSRFVPTEKVGDAWRILTTARAHARYDTERTAIDLVMFLLLTGARIDEAASLRWDGVHIVDEASECRWHITNRKRGEDVWMPLSSQAVALLKSRTPVKDSPYVFHSGSKKGYMDQPRGTLSKVAKVAGMHLSAHDMRRTFTNIAIAKCRMGKFETDLMTGHKPKKEDVTASHYLDISNLTWLHREVQQISDWIHQQAAIAEAQATGGNVVSLRA